MKREGPDRRDFLKFSVAGGALFATASLPTVAAEATEEVFPRRGKYERLSLGMR